MHLWKRKWPLPRVELGLPASKARPCHGQAPSREHREVASTNSDVAWDPEHHTVPPPFARLPELGVPNTVIRRKGITLSGTEQSFVRRTLWERIGVRKKKERKRTNMDMDLLEVLFGVGS